MAVARTTQTRADPAGDGDLSAERPVHAESHEHESSAHDSCSETSDSSTASYLYDSAETTTDSVDERDYFGDSEPSDTASSDGAVAWVDSEDDADLRAECPTAATAEWLTAEAPRTAISTGVRRIACRFVRDVLVTQHRVRHVLAVPGALVVVDAFNIIYLVADGQTTTYKLDKFSVTDVVFFAGRLIFCSAKSTFLKTLTLRGVFADVDKRIGRIAGLRVQGNRLYAFGDRLSLLDARLMVRATFNQPVCDACCGDGAVVALREGGDLLCLSPELRVLRRVAHPCRFRFQRVFAAHGAYFVTTDSGLHIFDGALSELRATENMQSAVTCFAANSEFVFHGCDYANSLRILRDGLVYYDRFPFARVPIPPLAALSADNECVYLGHGRAVSRLHIGYAAK